VVGTYSESKFTVKSADVGKIIGKGGCKIREFEEESGAHIQVNDTYLMKHKFLKYEFHVSCYDKF